MSVQKGRLPMVVLLAAAIVGGCSDSTPSTSASWSNLKGDHSSARTLGITGGPITEEQAIAIAEHATGGKATEVERETEDGVEAFEVEVQTVDGEKDVVVRISDAAVLKIESEDDDHDDGASDDHDDGDDDDDDDGGNHDGEHGNRKR